MFDKITAELWRNGKLVEDVKPEIKPTKIIQVNKKGLFSEVISIELIKN